MERLTERNPLWIDDEMWERACEPDCEEIDAVYRKLKDYEDAEEQGLLLRLPCGIGSDGTLYTTKAQRTGCSMCGFGIHMEKRPHRFDLLYESNPKEWDYLMFHMCKDKDGNDYGWAKVLDYIGVGWDPTTIGGNCKGQMRLEDFM